MQLVTAVTTELVVLAKGQFVIQHHTQVSNRSREGGIREHSGKNIQVHLSELLPCTKPVVRVLDGLSRKRFNEIQATRAFMIWLMTCTTATNIMCHAVQ